MSVYCVLGAKGQTGRLLVEKLVRKVGVKEVRCVVRDVERVPEFQKLINRPEINCSMSAPPYFYFSNSK